MFRAFQSRNRKSHGERPRALAAIAVVCLVLLALLTIAQVTHTHPVNSETDHCPLCIALHSAATVVATAAMITLVQVAVAAPAPEVRQISRQWHPQLFTRPPPIGW